MKRYGARPQQRLDAWCGEFLRRSAAETKVQCDLISSEQLWQNPCFRFCLNHKNQLGIEMKIDLFELFWHQDLESTQKIVMILMSVYPQDLVPSGDGVVWSRVEWLVNHSPTVGRVRCATRACPNYGCLLRPSWSVESLLSGPGGGSWPAPGCVLQ